MTPEEKIKQGLRNITAAGYEIFSGTAKNVDEGSGLMDVVLDDNEDGDPVPGVRLRALTDVMDGVLVIPEEGSDVIIGSIYGAGYYFLIMASKVEKFIVKIGAMSLVIDQNGIVFNNGGLDGLPIANKVIERLNKLENDVNAFKDVLSGWIVVAQDGGAALKSAASSWYSNRLTLSTDSDIKNEKVKQ